MALVQVDFFSEKLMRTVTINAIIPVDKKLNQPNKKFKTLYLLHGIFGNYTDWVCGTRIQRWAQDHDLAVIMPSGYGAIINGLKYYQTFGYIAALSSALLIDTFINAKDGDDVPYMYKRSYLTSVFGDLHKLKGSDKDYKALIQNMAIKDVPAIYMACGTDDSLIKENRAYRDFLLQQGINVTYEEGPGAHEWDFWDRYIERVLEWLPLDEKNEGLSSGHIE